MAGQRMLHTELIRKLQSRLERTASKKTKKWWEKYLRHVIQFRGVNLVDIRSELCSWYERERIAELGDGGQLDLALAFIAEKYAEDKLAGILFLENYLFGKYSWPDLLDRLSQLFKADLIFDWNVCDWFCVRVLGPLIKNNGSKCAEAVAKSASSENLWQARASVVSFAGLTAEKELRPIFMKACSMVIRRNDRFAKTGVGWVLRELSKTDKQRAEIFITEHRNWLSTESFNNATKYFDPTEKKRLRTKIGRGDAS